MQKTEWGLFGGEKIGRFEPKKKVFSLQSFRLLGEFLVHCREAHKGALQSFRLLEKFLVHCQEAHKGALQIKRKSNFAQVKRIDYLICGLDLVVCSVMPVMKTNSKCLEKGKTG
ncbi:hypothetical protein VNO77_08253 [Canavalia gladiata]|uniref:Uncharacterized protein n=1 Tax=Canavalia gladiata TaxID=3824 RepID=A0AAN9QTQ6_CANGL